MARAKPKLDWLAQAREAFNVETDFRKLGSADFTLGLVVADEARLVGFQAFEVASVAAADPRDLRDADIVIEMTARDWNAYLRQRARGRGPSLLSLDLEQRVVRCRTPLQRLLFERYNRTLQAFIDRGAALAA
jgi:hypothetical protein